MPADRFPPTRVLRRVAEQRSRRRRRKRIAWAVAAALAVVAVSVVGSVLWYSRPVDPGPVETIPEVSSAGESLLVILVDADRAVAFGLAVSHPELADRLILFPPALLTVLPGFGSWELEQSNQFGESGLPATTLTNLLGARIDGTVRIPVRVLAAMLEGASVALGTPVMEVQGDEQVVVVAAGEQVRDAQHLEAILATQGADDQLTWLVRQGLVLDVLFDEIASTAGLVDSLMEMSGGDLTLGRRVLAAFAGDADARITAAQVKPIASLGGSDERYQLGVDDAEALLDQHAPYLRLVEGKRPRVEVLNGTGRVAVTPPIAAKLVAEGFRVVLTDNADRDDYDVTRIVGHTAANQSTALAVHAVLGFGEVRLEVRQPSGIVDITVIVGNDFS
jgi:hypothetical protein